MARDYFHDLGEDLVHGAEESFVADLSEEMLDLLEDGMASEDRWAVVASRFREAALGAWARHERPVAAAAERAFRRALGREDEAISESLAAEFSAPAHVTGRAANEVMEAARGMAEIVRRQNVALADGLADTWWRVTADAVTRTQLGDDPRDVMERAVSRLARAGLETIDYRSGAKTTIDAAVRRHAVTQANQCRNDLLVRRCDEYGVELVFTSAHYGCRPTHAEWQGKPFSLHGTVEVDGVTYRDLGEATGYGTVGGLCGANCVVEGSLVSGPELSAAYRREYEGEVVAIRTALGHDLAVTPNHPVLTERGWVPAHEVKKGDHVFSRFLGDRVPPCVGPYEQHGEAAVEDVFDAAGNAFGVHALLGSAADFHGDGVFDQQVDVVLVDACLMPDAQATLAQHVSEPGFLDASGATDGSLGGGTSTEVLMAPLHSPDGIMGGPAELLPLVWGHPGEPGAHGVGPALGHDAVLFEPLAHGHGTDPEELRYACLRHAPFVESDDLFIVELLPAPVGGESELAQFIGNESVPASEVLPQLANGCAFLVQPDEVVDIDVRMWSGHVYNLQTRSGWYFADSIVTHNCRHRLTPYVPGLSKLPDTDFSAFERKYHMTSDEYYQATQRQRALERQVRATKREIALGQERGLDMTEARYRLGAQQQRLRDHCKQTGLPRDPERERAYGVRQQPRALNPQSRAAMARQEAEAERRKNVSSKRTYEGTSSPIANAASFDELDSVVGERLGGSLSWGVRSLDLGSVRSLACGIDDVATHYGIGEILPGQIAPARLAGITTAATSSSGTVRLNAAKFAHAFGEATSAGRHEAGHLVEVYLSRGDVKRFESASDAKRIVTRAFRAYKRDNPETTLTARKAIETYSEYPAREAARLKNPAVVYSEGLAEAVERIVGQEVPPGSFLAYMDESIRKELAR